MSRHCCETFWITIIKSKYKLFKTAEIPQKNEWSAIIWRWCVLKKENIWILAVLMKKCKVWECYCFYWEWVKVDKILLIKNKNDISSKRLSCLFMSPLIVILFCSYQSVFAILPHYAHQYALILFHRSKLAYSPTNKMT